MQKYLFAGAIRFVKESSMNDRRKTKKQLIEELEALRRKSDEEMRKVKIFSETVIESLPGIFYLFDENGFLYNWNRNLETVSGYSTEEISGMNPLDFFSGEDKKLVEKAIQEVLIKGEAYVEADLVSKDGIRTPYYFTGVRLISGDRPYLLGMGVDITERKLGEQARISNESRISALLELSRMTQHPDQVLTDFALEKAIELTHSTIGYLAFLNEEETLLTMYSWSRQAMKECMIEEKPIVYPIETTGLWGEAVRQRKPVVTNDYEAASPLKKGYPEGHVHVKRHMNIPLFDGDRIVLVAGVGNKEVPYEESDIQQLTLLMDGMWKIIKQKRADEALRDSEEKYYSAMDNASDVILFADWDGYIIEANKKAEELLGYTKRQLAAMHYSMIHPPEELERTTAAFNEIILRGYTHFREGVILRKDGTTINVDMIGSLMAYGGRLVIHGIYSDITERKRNEDEVNYALSLQKSTIESTADGILVVDGKGKIVSFNQKFVEMWHLETGILKSGDEGRALSFAIEQLTDPESFMIKVKELYEHPDKKSFDVIEFKDGRYFERYSQPQEIEGKILGRVWSFRDVTDRKKSEEAIRESEEKYRLLFENASDAIFIAQDGLIKFPNSQLSLLSGYDFEELSMRPFINFIHPDDSEMIAERHKKRLQGEDIPSVYSFRIINKKGEVRWVEVSVVFLTWEGRPATLNFLRDIHVQKKLEEQLLHAQKMEAIGQLAGGVAHDFNNLLTAIIGYSHLLKDETIRDSPGSLYIGQILSAAERASILTKDLLTFSRRQIVNLQPVDLNRIIRNMKGLLLRVIGEDTELSTLLTDSDLTIMADSTQIDQILMNLATNAQDAMPKGGKLIVSTDRVEINGEYIRRYGYGKPGSYAVLSVEDTGAGMDEKIRERIFEPFFTTKEVGKGTGLGLAMVYGIVKQHDGYINVYSEPGSGTTFKILLPLVQIKTEDLIREALSGSEGGTETVLIAEDDTNVRNLLKEILLNAGYHITEAVDGDEGLKVFLKNKDNINLLMLDVIMPRKNGKELYEEIKKIKPDIKVIFVSGYSADVIHKKGMLDAGMNFISKPVSPDELLKQVRDILDK